MTMPNSPKVMRLIGRVKILRIGLTKALSRPSMTATTISVVRSSPYEIAG